MFLKPWNWLAKPFLRSKNWSHCHSWNSSCIFLPSTVKFSCTKNTQYLPILQNESKLFTKPSKLLWWEMFSNSCEHCICSSYSFPYLFDKEIEILDPWIFSESHRSISEEQSVSESLRLIVLQSPSKLGECRSWDSGFNMCFSSFLFSVL